MISCAKFQVSNLNLISLRPFWATGESYQKSFNIILSAHRRRVYAKFGVYSSYGVRETLSGHDRYTDGRKDMAKSIFLIALIKNIYTL